MNYKNAIITALRALGRNKMRSSLTSVGIIIGVFSVIVMFGMGTSARIAIKEKLTAYGTNTIWVIDKKRPITQQDISELKKMEEIEYVSPYLQKGLILKYAGRYLKSEVRGINNDYFLIMNRYATQGRVFSDKESFQLAKVAVIGTVVAKKLFKGENPLGKIISVGNLPVKIIGIANEKGRAMTGHDFDNMVFLPFTTLNSRINQNRPLKSIFVSSSREENFQLAYLAVENFFRKRHNLEAEDDNAFKINSSQDKLKMANDISAAMVVLIAGIASISLFVGGVGIMNIMLVSVTERTREIGIRMAIGAKKSDIMMQFLIESTTLSLFGGITGITSGLIVYFLITWIVKWPFIVSVPAITISFLFAAMVGIFFGYYPSRKASNLKPIEALKYE